MHFAIFFVEKDKFKQELRYSQIAESDRMPACYTLIDEEWA
jgi:hypothetical protein